MAEPAEVAKLRLTRAGAQSRIRSIAQDSANLVWGNHARSRMTERGIDDGDVLRVLRGGFVDEDPVQTERGEWQCKITKHIRGGRDAGVVTIILDTGRLFLRTVEWEDRK